jgi:hypothetical protein
VLYCGYFVRALLSAQVNGAAVTLLGEQPLAGIGKRPRCERNVTS